MSPPACSLSTLCTSGASTPATSSGSTVTMRSAACCASSVPPKRAATAARKIRNGKKASTSVKASIAARLSASSAMKLRTAVFSTA